MERDRAIECGRIVITKARCWDDVVRILLSAGIPENRCDTLEYMTMRDTTKERARKDVSKQTFTPLQEGNQYMCCRREMVTHIVPR